MRKKNIENIMKKHLELSEDDNFNIDSIPSPPEWLTEKRKRFKEEKLAGHFRMPRWCWAAVGALAMFVLMLSPTGHAVSEFVYSINIKWNAEKNMLDISYGANVSGDPSVVRPSQNMEISNIYNTIEEVRADYPGLEFVTNSEYLPERIETMGFGISLDISYNYDIDGAIVNMLQTIYFTDMGRGGGMLLEGDAVAIDTYFNDGTIRATGSHEHTWGYVDAFYKNSEIQFVCDNMELEDFLNFIENCHIG